MDKSINRALQRQGLNRVEGDTYNLPLPTDEQGRTGRECKNPNCSPAYFLVKGGTGIQEVQATSFCPYCRHEDAPNNFYTREQMRYLKDNVKQAGAQAIGDALQAALGGGKKRYGGGPLSFEVSLKRSSFRPIRKPIEENLKRCLICPHCGLDHAVFGLAFWCPDCGRDLFLDHVRGEFQVIKAVLDDVDRRRKELGERIAAKDIENCLEDVVSTFEAVMKIVVRRSLEKAVMPPEEINKALKKVGNAFQNHSRAEATAKEHLHVALWSCLSKQESDFLRAIFEKRHPITHNLGVVDKKYIERAMPLEQEGREVRVYEQELLDLIEICQKVIDTTYRSI